MLRKPNSTFDSVAFLDEFIGILQAEEMQIVTYRDFSTNPDLTAIENDRLFIITIDDIYLHYPISERVLQMIDLLKEAGYPAVLGVTTESHFS